MALPTTITGISTAVACAGPFKSSGGNYYFFGVNSTNSDKIDALKASDPTSSFSVAGTSPTPISTVAVQWITAVQVSDVIHLACAINAGGTSASCNFAYYTFDMSTDTWSSKE